MTNEANHNRHRPGYHLTPLSGTCGDITGTIFYEGRYHVMWGGMSNEDRSNPNHGLYEKLPWGPHINKDILLGILAPLPLGPRGERGSRELGILAGCHQIHPGWL